MNVWDDQLSTLRAEDEENQENMSHVVQDLRAWVENLMMTWDGRWVGYCKRYQDTVSLDVWILRDPREGSPWISTPLTSNGEVIRLRGTGPSLHYGMGNRSLELPYIDGTWHLSEELQSFWLRNIANCVQEHEWATLPTRQNAVRDQQGCNHRIRSAVRGIVEYALVFVGLAVAWFGTLMFISFVFTGHWR